MVEKGQNFVYINIECPLTLRLNLPSSKNSSVISFHLYPGVFFALLVCSASSAFHFIGNVVVVMPKGKIVIGIAA